MVHDASPMSNDWFALSDLGAGGSLHCHLWRKGNNQLASCHPTIKLLTAVKSDFTAGH